MINLEQTYSPRANPADANYPFGSIKDNTTPGANDGTPLTAVWGNDFEGFRQAAMTEAGITPSGLQDTAQDSQLLDAVKAVTSGALRDDLAESTGINLIGGVSSTVQPGYAPKFGDTSGVATLVVPDVASQRLFIDKTCTNPDDFGVLQVNRFANYTGGTAGAVGTAIVVKTTVSSSAKKTSEWTALFQLDNSAPNDPIGGGPGSGALPQNCALYGQAHKRGNGSTWSLCTEINDYLAAGDGSTIGHELACSANGPDASIPQRNSSHAAIGKLVSGGLDLEWGRGYWVSTGAGARVRYAFDSTAEIGDSVFHSAATTGQAAGALMRDVGTLTQGIDLTGANYTSGMAMRLKVGLKIGFNATNAYTLMGSDAVGGIICGGVFQMQNSFSMPSSGNVSTTASAGTQTLPSNPSGFINIKIDGVAARIPYYGA